MIKPGIETRLSDGLENLSPSEAEVILIAGMGGGLTVHILSEGLDRIRLAGDLVLQPQSERGAVRRFLLEHDFYIAEEVTVVGNNTKRPDLVVYVNGIALAVIELKNERE